jgi:hypothetical protein
MSSDSQAPPLRQRLLIIPPIVAGVLIIVVLAALRSGPERIDLGEQAVSVRVLTAREMDVVPRALGYGEARPAREWQAVAEVNGKIIEINDQLEVGSLMAKDEVLLRIDPTEYELLVSQRRANLQSVEAQLAQLEVEEANQRANLEIERRALALAENDLKRNVELLERSSISEALMEQIERDVLRQRTQVQNLENSLALIPTRRDQLVAQQVLAAAQLKDAERSLRNTVIRAPYPCRVAARNVVGAEYIRAGTVVAVAHGVERVEVEAQIPTARLRHLLDPDFEVPEVGEVLDSDEFFARLGLTAVVRLAGGEEGPQWPARFDRIGATIDPVTRTSVVFVSVDEPYRQAAPGVRPPLVKGMYCEVELRGEPRRALPVPREAVHEDQVYVVGAGDRLEVRQVEVAHSHGELAVIRAGLEAGEQVVLSDLVPAIAGTLLKPIADPVADERLERYARGEGMVR